MHVPFDLRIQPLVTYPQIYPYMCERIYPFIQQQMSAYSIESSLPGTLYTRIATR